MASKKRKAATKKAGARKGRKPGGVNKSAFIRQHPDLKAGELVAKAKSAGIKLTPAFVYAVRSASGRKKTGKSGERKPARGGQSRSDFVRAQLAAGKSPGEIMAEGAKAGLRFSRNLVYAVKAKRGAPSAARRGPGRPPRSATRANGSSEAAFRKLAFDMGLARAREVLDDLERRLRALIEA